MDFASIAAAFTSHYYASFDAGGATRQALASLYRPESMLTWESAGSGNAGHHRGPDQARTRHGQALADLDRRATRPG